MRWRPRESWSTRWLGEKGHCGSVPAGVSNSEKTFPIFYRATYVRCTAFAGRQKARIGPNFRVDLRARRTSELQLFFSSSFLTYLTTSPSDPHRTELHSRLLYLKQRTHKCLKSIPPSTSLFSCRAIILVHRSRSWLCNSYRYGYIPSLSYWAIFIAIFAITLTAHTVQVVVTRRMYFMICMVLGCLGKHLLQVGGDNRLRSRWFKELS